MIKSLIYGTVLAIGLALSPGHSGPVINIPDMNEGFLNKNYHRLPIKKRQVNKRIVRPVPRVVVKEETIDNKVTVPEYKPGGHVKGYGPGDYRKEPSYCGSKNGVPSFSDNCRR